MKFLIDQNLPLALRDWLIERGFTAEHVRDVDLAGAPDVEILLHAKLNRQVIVTRDKDYVSAAGGHVATWQKIVWVRIGNMNTNGLLSSWSDAWPHTLARLKNGDELIDIAA